MVALKFLTLETEKGESFKFKEVSKIMIGSFEPFPDKEIYIDSVAGSIRIPLKDVSYLSFDITGENDDDPILTVESR